MFKKLVLATHNAGKVVEIAKLLQPYGIECVSAADLGIEEPQETEDTFEGNARLKALASAKASNLPAIADDSGLCVNSLSGAPGIFSARWAQKPDGTRDFNYAMKRIDDELQPHEDKSAYFICALAIALPNGKTRVFEGRVDGDISYPPRGANGFGYDPIFVPSGHTRTFAQMEAQEKDAMSHRTKAFALLEDVFKRGD